MRFNRSGSPRWRVLTSVVAIGMLAGCAAQSAVAPLPANPGAVDSFAQLGLAVPGVTPPAKCKSEKNTKEYSEVLKEVLKQPGGSLCVPEFAGWGGALQYPQIYGSYPYDVQLISSTTAYKGGMFPPAGSKKAIFYLQLRFNSFPGFYPTLPKGNPLVSSHLIPKRKYTLELFEYFYGLGWNKQGSCYQIAGKSLHGGSFPAAGAVFEKLTFLEHDGAIEIFNGALVTNKC